jgi:hypothetical protein
LPLHKNEKTNVSKSLSPEALLLSRWRPLGLARVVCRAVQMVSSSLRPHPGVAPNTKELSRDLEYVLVVDRKEDTGGSTVA